MRPGDSPSNGHAAKRRFALKALGGLVAMPWLSPPVAASEPVKLGYLPVNAMTTIYTGAANAWTGSDISVELTRLQGGPAIVQAIQSGSIQTGEIAVTVLLSLASRKIPIVALASCNNATRDAPYNRIMVPKGSSLRSVSDLKGKTVGILALGTLDHVQLLAALKAAGLNAGDVKIVSIPVPNQPQALAAEQVDAMVMPPPADAVAERHFGARQLADATESLPYYPLEVLAVDARWMKRNHAAADALVVGWIKACRWIDDHAEATRSVMKQTLSLQPDIAESARLPKWSRNCLPVMPGFWNLYYAMVTNKLIEPASDPESMMREYVIEPTTEFVLPALKKLGRQPDLQTDALASLALPYLPKAPQTYLAPWEKS